MKVEIDQSARFCFGVERAIKKAETELAKGQPVYCLGEIVHNKEEMNRLEELGLKTISHDQFYQLKNVPVLIRAHGEPPATYDFADSAGISLIEATCPVVSMLHKKVRKTLLNDPDAQIVIAGKKEHPEIIGLSGHAGKQAILVENMNDLDKPDFSKPINLFVQTTLNPNFFEDIKNILKKKLKQAGSDDSMLKINNRICGQVANRIPDVKRFCAKYDVIVFVSGKNSSNGRSIFAACQSINSNSHFISSEKELDIKWFIDKSTVGVSGATSTPEWLLDKVAEKIREIV